MENTDVLSDLIVGLKCLTGKHFGSTAAVLNVLYK